MDIVSIKSLIGANGAAHKFVVPTCGTSRYRHAANCSARPDYPKQAPACREEAIKDGVYESGREDGVGKGEIVYPLHF